MSNCTAKICVWVTAFGEVVKAIDTFLGGIDRDPYADQTRKLLERPK